MARPVCKGFCRDRRLISLLQRIRPRRSPPGQDGDTRAPVLINSSASCAVFNIRLPERRLTVRPSRRHPLANLACTTGAFAPTERILRGHGYRPGVKRFPALQHRPGDPRQLVGQGDDHDIAMGPAHQPFHPPAKRRVALGHIGQSRTRSMDQLPAQVFVAALADPEQLRLTASCELTGNQAEPRGEIAPAVEAFRPTDGGDKGGCGSAGRRVGLKSAGEPLRSQSPSGRSGVERRDPSIEFRPLRASVGDEHDHPRAQSRCALRIQRHGQERSS